jgi:hypothetical protein
MKMTFDDIKLRKERLKNQILRKEYEIRDTGRLITANLTVPSLKSQAMDILIYRPDLVVKAGMVTYNLVRLLRQRKAK